MRAGALVGAVAVLAGAAVQAGFGVALVDVMLTVVPGEARQAQAREGVDAVHTGAAVEAGAEGRRKNRDQSSEAGLKYSVAFSLSELQANSHLKARQERTFFRSIAVIQVPELTESSRTATLANSGATH